MKVLIISNEKDTSQQLDSLFKNHGYETIKYKWLLKALDNLEEIEPSCIIVNSYEYPRHWKIISQYIKSEIAGEGIKFYLYAPEDLSLEELKKIEFLGVDGIFKDFSQSETDKLFENLNDKTGFTVENIEEEIISVSDLEEGSVQLPDDTEELFSVDEIVENEENTKVSGVGDFIFNNPLNGNFVCGKYLDFNGSRITCKISDEECIENLQQNEFIKYFSYSNTIESRSMSVKVEDILDFVDGKFLILDVVNYYDE